MYKVVHIFKNTYNSEIKLIRLLSDDNVLIDIDKEKFNKLLYNGSIEDAIEDANGNIEININNVKTTPYLGDRESLMDWCLSHGERGSKLLREWNEEYLKPSEISAHSTEECNWICYNLKEPHEFRMQVHYRTSSNRDCNRCGKLGNSTFYEQSLEKWCVINNREDILEDYNRAKNSKIASEVRHNSSNEVNWVCKNGHEFTCKINLRTLRNYGCKLCNQTGTSKIEYILFLWLNKALNFDVKHRYKLDTSELDIYIPDLNIAIDYRGFYYHKDRLDTDLRRNDIAKSNNIDIIIIQETEYKEDKIYDNTLEIYKSRKDKTQKCIEFISNILISKGISLKSVNLGELYKEYSDNINKVDMDKSFGFKNKHMIDYWDEEELTPYDILANDTREYKFKCIICNTQYKAVPHVITQKNSKNSTGCPVCSSRSIVKGKNDLATTQPNLLKIWDFNKNVESPYEISRSKRGKIYTICPKCGNEGYTELSSLLVDTHCKACMYSTLVEDKTKEYNLYNCDGCRDDIDYISYMNNIYLSLDDLIYYIIDEAIQEDNTESLIKDKLLYNICNTDTKNMKLIGEYCYKKINGNPYRVRQLLNIIKSLNIDVESIKIKFKEA